MRSRIILLVALSIVEHVQTYLTRWKCTFCLRTFTLYPEFAQPHKRYALPSIQERCAAYVEDKARTYAQSVSEGGLPIMYEDSDSGKQLWPSTVWRWISALGGFAETTRQALHLIQQKSPSTGLFRELGAWRIGERKYRSKARKHALERCLSLLAACQVYGRLFGSAVFPELATACGFR